MAEIEISNKKNSFAISNKKNSVAEQELEAGVRNLAANTSYHLFIDGRPAAFFKTNHRGAAELELTNMRSS